MQLDEAMACGYDGCVLLHGLLGEDSARDLWRPMDVVYGRPVYFGMLAAAYVPRAVAPL